MKQRDGSTDDDLEDGAGVAVACNPSPVLLPLVHDWANSCCCSSQDGLLAPIVYNLGVLGRAHLRCLQPRWTAAAS